MVEPSRDISYDPIERTVTINGAFPRLTDLGAERLRECGALRRAADHFQ